MQTSWRALINKLNMDLADAFHNTHLLNYTLFVVAAFSCKNICISGPISRGQLSLFISPLLSLVSYRLSLSSNLWITLSEIWHLGRFGGFYGRFINGFCRQNDPVSRAIHPSSPASPPPRSAGTGAGMTDLSPAWLSWLYLILVDMLSHNFKLTPTV